MGATLGLAGIFTGIALAAGVPQGTIDSDSRPIVRVQSDEDPAYAKLKATLLVMRGVLGCQKLDALFTEEDVAVVENSAKRQAGNFTRAQVERAWNEVEEQAGDAINRIYWDPDRAEVCDEVGQAAEQLLGLDLPSYD